MYLKRGTDLFKTFQFRLTLYYAGLTTLALIATFAIGHMLIHQELLSETEQQLKSIMEQLAAEYLGENAPEEINEKNWPEDIQAIFHKTYPDMAIGMIEKQDNPQGTSYGIMGSSGTKRIQIMIGPTGASWIVHSAPIIEVFDSLKTLLTERNMIDPGGNPHLVLLAPDGTVRGGTLSATLTLKQMQLLHHRLQDQPSVQLLGSNGASMMAKRLFDGNILCIADDFYEGTRVLLRWGIFFLSITAFFLPLSCAIGWFLSGKAMAGVKRVTSTARMVETGNLQARVQSRHEGIEIETLADAFNSMVSRIELLMRELKDVTANIAHDLRTPITRIRGLIETTDWERAADIERSETANMVIEECDRLTPLINDILELAQAEAGTLELHRERFDVNAEIQKAVSIFSALAEDKNIDLQVEFPSTPVNLMGDRSRIQRVVANLLDNAIKYTPPDGWVCLRLSTTNTHLLLEVVDNGVGIPAQEADRIFERFYRCAPGRSIPGNGLGLSIANAFVKAHDGTLQLVHNHHNGCTMVVRLPLNEMSDS
ncbi:MAG: HAMP domain-containing histidine kinase [Kiritimatiellales bacterium]|nr:HAMP domain-containing histidine kinase [Kiritimatiellales bacterium]